MTITNNYQKHTNKNPIQKFLISNFYKGLLSSIEGLKLDSVLDVGCGEGFTLARLQDKGIAKRLEGIDISQDAIDLGREIHPNLSLQYGDIHGLPFSDDSFDLVLCTEVLEHLEDPKKALNEIARVSKRYCLLSVPCEPFFRIMNFLRGKNVSRLGDDVEHIQHWSSKSFQGFIEERLKVLKQKKPLPWNLILAEKRKDS